MYALNTRKGTTISHPEVSLKGGFAVPVSDRLANQLKHIINVIVFDGIAGVNEDNVVKKLYDVYMKTLNRPNEIRNYESFVREFKDVKVAAQKWEVYKKEMSLK